MVADMLSASVEKVSEELLTMESVDWEEMFNGLEKESVDGCRGQKTSLCSSSCCGGCGYASTRQLSSN